ncbi:beta strand repeat-containing protein [Piscinibacter defluvii]|uniref:beta strand repeat-containing protein n=1 Tax=Piscinibacter defluvii TaxID=1796922 RepID=UPI000FDF0140|nr:calcium-binding protein [Piscinibacter defluvii]
MATFNGTAGNNNFAGTAADDIFNYGNVTFSAGTVTAGRGLDTISGGGGFDRLSFANLPIDYIDGERVGNDLFLYIQPNVNGDTTITTIGGVKVSNFFAADGNGVIDRIDFTDTYALSTYAGGIWRVNVHDHADVLQWTTVDGSAAGDSIVGTAVDDEISGLGGNDSLIGGLGNDELRGDEGNDTLNGGASDDTLDGGAGIDTITYSGANGSLRVDLAGGVTLQFGATNIGTDTFTGIERVVGGSYNDTLQGNVEHNVLNGGAGNDALYGYAGNDSLLGGAGEDFADGSAGALNTPGEGNDTIDGGTVTDKVNYFDGNMVGYVLSGAGVVVDLQTGTASDGGGGTDTLRNINFVRASAFDDSIAGSTRGGFEQFWGNGGNDTIDGGVVSDTLNGTDNNRVAFDQIAVSVIVDLQAGTATGQGNDTLININQVRGSNAADTIRGSNSTTLVEQIEGRLGNDVLDGRGGTDFVRYQYATNAVNVNLSTGVGNAGSLDVDTLANFEGIRGSNFGDTLTGGNAANAALEFFRGMGGNDTIDGGAGYDRVEYVDSVKAVSVTLGGAAAGTAQDGQAVLNGVVVRAGTAGATYGTDTLLNIEGVRGSDYNDTLTGSNIATLEVFEGRKGNDLIDGNGGLDRAGYFQATSGVVATLGLNGADGAAADGYGSTDTLRDIENLQGSRDFADRLTGNQLANLLDGQGGNDTLSGGSGNDTLLGGGGADLLIGGNGNDVLTGHAGGDLFRFTGVPNAGSNSDRITDFVAADDTIQLDDAGFVGVGALGALAAGAYRAGTAAADASDRVIYDSATGKLYFDADGNGAGAQVLFATLTAGTALSVADFVIV